MKPSDTLELWNALSQTQIKQEPEFYVQHIDIDWHPMKYLQREETQSLTSLLQSEGRIHLGNCMDLENLPL